MLDFFVKMKKCDVPSLLFGTSFVFFWGYVQLINAAGEGNGTGDFGRGALSVNGQTAD